AQVQGQGAVLFQFDGGAVDTAGAGRLFHLGKDGHVPGGVPSAGFDSDDDADAHEPSLFARFHLLVAQLVVVDFFQQGGKQSRIIAVIVDVGANRLIGHFVGLDEVLSPYLDRAQLQRLSDPIHHALPDVAHAGFADAPVGDDRTFIGDDSIAFHVNGRRPVGIGEVVEFVGEVNRQGADRAANIVVFLETKAKHGAVVIDRRLGFELLSTGMAASHHVLAAVFDPFDWTSGFHRKQGNQHDVFANQMNLLTEASADVGNDHANILQAEGFTQAVVNDFRHLRRHPNGQTLACRIVGGDDDERFERRRAVAVNLQVFLDHAVGRFESGIDIAVLERTLPGKVRAQFVEQSCRRRLDRFAHVDDGSERFVIDLNQFERVFRRAAIARRYGADGLADVPDLFDGTGILVDGPFETGGISSRLERFRKPFNVLRRDHRHHVEILERFRRVDGIDLGVGVGAPQNHRLKHAWQPEIIRIETAARHVTGTFFAADARTDVFFISHKSLPFSDRVTAHVNKIRN